METAEKCCQANTQFAEISEVSRRRKRMDDDAKQGLLTCGCIESYKCGGRDEQRLDQKFKKVQKCQELEVKIIPLLYFLLDPYTFPLSGVIG